MPSCNLCVHTHFEHCMLIGGGGGINWRLATDSGLRPIDVCTKKAQTLPSLGQKSAHNGDDRLGENTSMPPRTFSYMLFRLLHLFQTEKGSCTNCSGKGESCYMMASLRWCFCWQYFRSCYHRQVILELDWSEITIRTTPPDRLFGPTVEILFKLN